DEAIATFSPGPSTQKRARVVSAEDAPPHKKGKHSGGNSDEEMMDAEVPASYKGKGKEKASAPQVLVPNSDDDDEIDVLHSASSASPPSQSS
ncbi:hypothetical protein BYT27DRAFT_7249596, partial [Phlegmacium glaucopus]